MLVDTGMGERWRTDLAGDGVAGARIDELVAASFEKLTTAPALLVGCLTWDGLDRYPDEARMRAEWGMALLSLGAAVENLMLAATDAGLASCWVAAPIFCPEEARDALDRGFRRLPSDQRAVFVLYHYLDLPLGEIAETLGVPLGTVKSRLHYATASLRAALEADARPSTPASRERMA